ncbi:MAG: aldehyde oxidase [Solirubrobacterales bacterium]|nr:aldehyde oxidase [Solirubrobacterales bacterium]
MTASYREVGGSAPRIDARDKVTGAAGFTADMHVPGALHAVIVRSALPHARIDRIDVADARAWLGVHSVLTAAELEPFVTANRFGPAIKDMPLLAEDVVRYEGEPIALVLGESPAAARDAAAAVNVSLTALQVVATPEEGLAPDAPLLHAAAESGEFAGSWSSGHDPSRNLAGQYHDRRGDPDAALAAAELVVSGEYRLPPLQHYALENHIAVAIPSGRRLVVHTPNQYPFLMVQALANLLGRAESDVRVIVPYVGGSFGSKEYVNVVPLAAVAAVATGRAVRLELTVEESFRSSGRHAAVVRYTSGITGGRIVARRVELLFDTGAYADQGPRVIRQAGYRSPGPYAIPNIQVDAFAVYTNKVPAGAYRGFGASQPIHGCECHMDDIAAALDVDPVELRRQHLLGLGDDFSPGDLPLDCDLPAALDIAITRLGDRRPARAADGRLIGTGVAVGAKNTASGRLPSTAIARIHQDGSATILAAGVEMGQGGHTMLARVVAETLGLGTDRVRVVGPDTAITPFDQRTSSSRMTVHLGLAAQRAAEDARRQLLDLAAARTGIDVMQLELRDGAVVGADVRLSCKELITARGSGLGGEVVGVGHVDQAEPEAATAFGLRAGYWEGSVGAARVAVDPETGAVEVLDFITVGDAGRVLNPLAAHGQERGGVVMALGHALSEKLEFVEGYLRNPSPVDYRVPLAHDIPTRLESHFLERGDGPGPFGSKGLGESSIITTAPAIANAITAAIGVRLHELPMRPWDVWQACRQAASVRHSS